MKFSELNCSKVHKDGEFLSPAVLGGSKRTADRDQDDPIITSKLRRTDWNTMNKQSKSKSTTSDLEIDDDISSVDSNNLYSSLPRNSSGNEIFETRRTRTIISKKTTKQLPPPITVFGLIHNEIIDIISKVLPTDDYGIKHTKNGTKIYTQTNEQHKTLQDCFKKNNKQFFTHTLINERKLKFVIYGLHPVPIDELKTELNLKGINPIEIKKLNIKNLKFEN